MKIVKHYREDAALRSSFNALAEATFGLNFENWYQLGWWRDTYAPYSVLEDGKIVANVSVNRTDMVIDGQRKHLYQLGTVMTYPEYRNRGYIRTIMAEVEKDIAGADGIYLFANDEVLDFYPKFGFVRNREFVYSREVTQEGECTAKQMPMDVPENRDRLAAAMAESTFHSGSAMVDNPGLIFFYVAQFMQENVYTVGNAWVIAEEEEGNLVIHNVFGPEETSLDAVIAAFGPEVKTVTLGFTPADRTGWNSEELKEEDTTFFTRGTAFQDFADRNLRIPSLSHA
jgi:GNAT superfamily N-acetyltransferase